MCRLSVGARCLLRAVLCVLYNMLFAGCCFWWWRGDWCLVFVGVCCALRVVYCSWFENVCCLVFGVCRVSFVAFGLLIIGCRVMVYGCNVLFGFRCVCLLVVR